MRALHLPLHARLHGAVDGEFLNGDVEHVGDARQADLGIEDLQDLLTLFDGELDVRRDHVGELGRFVGTQGRGGLLIQRLLQLGVLLKKLVNAGDKLLHLRRIGQLVA